MATLGIRSAIAHAAVDETFRRSLLADPASACRKAGYEINETDLSTLSVLNEGSFGTSFYAAQSLPDLFQGAHDVVTGLGPVSDNQPDQNEVV